MSGGWAMSSVMAPPRNWMSWQPLLMDAVVDVEGLELGGLGLKPPDVVRVQQVGQDQVAFHFQVFDAFSQGHPGPIGLDDAVFAIILFEHVSLVSRGG